MKTILIFLLALMGLSAGAQALTVTGAGGGITISADTAGNSPSAGWTTLGPITLSENKNGHRTHFRAGTNVTLGLQAPAGFQFNTTVVPSVSYTEGRDITAASLVFKSSTLLTVTFTVRSGSNRDSLVIGDTVGLQVQPVSNAPLASGNIFRPQGGAGGTAVIKGVVPTSNLSGVGGGATSFGRLVEVAGAPTQLGIQVQPSQNAVVGISFGRQPVIAVQDMFGNVKTNIDDLVIMAVRGDGTGNLLGTTAAITVDGIATFTNLAADEASTITIRFSAVGLNSVTSAPVSVAPVPLPPAATSLSLGTQPSSTATAGQVFARQPVVLVLDQYDFAYTNTAGISITAERLSGNGVLQGTTTIEAIGGVATFTNLSHTAAGNITIKFSAGSLETAVSEQISVVEATADRLAFATEPGSATFGTPFGVQPVVVTRDAYGNFSTVGISDSLSLEIALLSGTGTLSGTLVQDIGGIEDNGVAIFTDLQIDLAGQKQLVATATGFQSATSAVFTVASQSQTIDFAALTDKVFGDSSFGVSATASSGLPVTFSVLSGPATITNGVVTITGVGKVVIRASQAGNDNYASAVDVDREFTVSKGDQAITFGSLAGKTYGDASFSVSATASSGLTVSFSIASGPATITNGLVTLTGAGTVTIRASQGGDDNYNAALDVTQSFEVSKAAQTITFGPLADKTYGDAPFTVSATTDSGLTVSFIVISGTATISNDVVTITSGGMVTIRASQGGNENYNAAADVDQSFNVAKLDQTITFAELPFYPFGSGAVTLSASASSGLPVSFTVVSGNASIFMGTMTATPGEITIRASQAGNSIYNPAPPVDRTFVAGKGFQEIYGIPPGSKTFGDLPFQLNFGATSLLPVSYVVLSGSATIDGNIITLNGPGEVRVRVSQDGNGSYNAAANLEFTFNVIDPTVSVKCDFNGDGKADIFFQNGRRVLVWLMNGLQFQRSVAVAQQIANTNWTVVGQDDFNRDGKQDILWQHTTGSLLVWYMDGRQRIGTASMKKISVSWKVAAVCDMNNDTYPDVVFQTQDGRVAIRYMRGVNIKGISLFNQPNASGWKVCGAGNIDAGTVGDLLVQHTDGRVAIWKGFSQVAGLADASHETTAILGAFGKHVNLNSGKAIAWKVVGLADLNQNGKLDIVLHSRDGRLAVWTMNRAVKTGRAAIRDDRRVLSAKVVGPR